MSAVSGSSSSYHADVQGACGQGVGPTVLHLDSWEPRTFHAKLERTICAISSDANGSSMSAEQIEAKSWAIATRVLKGIVAQNAWALLSTMSFSHGTSLMAATCLHRCGTVNETLSNILAETCVEKKEEYRCLLWVVHEVSEQAIRNSIGFGVNGPCPSYKDIIEAAFVFAAKEMEI